MRRTAPAWLVVLLSNVAFASDAPLSASELLHQFWNHDPKAAALTGKPVRLSGLVSTKPGARLALQTDERGYFVRCTNEIATVPPPGTLVIIEANAPRERDSHVDVDDCLVTWTEAALFERIPAGLDTAAVLARSALLCREMDSRLNRIPEGVWFSEFGLYPTTRRALVAFFSNRASEPIPCGNVAMLMLEQCRHRWLHDPWNSVPFIVERDLVFEVGRRGARINGTECDAQFIAEALFAAPMGDTSTQHDRRSWIDQVTRRTKSP